MLYIGIAITRQTDPNNYRNLQSQEFLAEPLAVVS